MACLRQAVHAIVAVAIAVNRIVREGVPVHGADVAVEAWC